MATMDDIDDSLFPSEQNKIGILRDIQEREVTDKEPSAPSLPSTSKRGFPAHKTRHPPHFMRKRQNESPNKNQALTSISQARNPEQHSPTGKNVFDSSIDQENRDRLAEMSEEDILRAQRELESSLTPTVIDRLLKRRDASNDSEIPDESTEGRSPYRPGVTEAVSTSTPSQHTDHGLSSLSLEDKPPARPPDDLHPVASSEPLPPAPDIHFPQRPPAPELDPDDPDFLEKLHSTYFPSLPADPTNLAWMSAPTDEEQSQYSPDQASFAPSTVRFDFRGRLLPPRLSSQIPVSKGLHHHGLAPKSAGYTIPELSRLSRSSVASQQCIAFQTLGRILFRMGKGEFGREGDDLFDGLWELIETSQVLQVMIRIAANENEGNRSVWATATDAVWLWRKGGGKPKKEASSR